MRGCLGREASEGGLHRRPLAGVMPPVSGSPITWELPGSYAGVTCGLRGSISGVAIGSNCGQSAAELLANYLLPTLVCCYTGLYHWTEEFMAAYSQGEPRSIETIGSAFIADCTIVLHLRAEGPDGVEGEVP